MKKQIIATYSAMLLLAACNANKADKVETTSEAVDTTKLQTEINIASHDASYQARAKQIIGTWQCADADNPSSTITIEFLEGGVLNTTNLPGDKYTNWELDADNLDRIVISGIQESERGTFTVTEMLEKNEEGIRFMGRPMVLKKK